MFKAPLSLSNQLLKATWEKHELVFKRPAKTSREIFNTKDTYVLKISFEDVESDFENVFNNYNSDKSNIITIIKKYVPDFMHIETGKHLDQKM